MYAKAPAITLLIKPSSGKCNLSCSYCFYHDETAHRKHPDYGYLSESTMEVLVKKAIESCTHSVTFAFQGGEPMLIGLDFYKKFSMAVQKYKKPNIEISCTLQTNGTLIDEAWAKYFHEHKFLVGISLDGYEQIHDLYRKASTCGSWKRVMKGIQLLKNYGVEFNVLTVVTKQSAKHISGIYSCFKNNGFNYQQYIPCLDPLEHNRGQEVYSLTPEIYAIFLKKLFDLWYSDISKGNFIYIRQFENYLGIFKGYAPESCNMCGVCQKQWVIEADGSVFPCDFYVLDAWKLGNILTDSFEAMDEKRDQLGFIKQSQLTMEACRHCRWFPVCRNGCKRDRVQADGQLPGLNYFCESYRSFFEYTWPRFEELALHS